MFTISFKKSKGKLNQKHMQALGDKLKSLDDGAYIVTVEKNTVIGNPLGRYWAVLKIIATHVGDESKALHEEYKKMYNGGMSTKFLKNNQDWSKYLSQVIHHGRTFHNCVIQEQITPEELKSIEDQYRKSFY